MSAATLTPQARRDILTAVRWIAKDNPMAARGLRDALAKATNQIGEHVHIGVSRPDLAPEPYRFMTLTGFPYVIVYNAERKPPLVVRVLHGARDIPEILKNPPA